MSDNTKKVAIITRHAVSNYGSVLQAYALQKAIGSFGFESEIIDYIRFDEDYKNIADTLVKKSSWNKNIATRLVYKSIQSPEYIKMGRAFEKYRKNLLIESSTRYCSIDELKKNPPKADIYCTGSDQVWGAIGNDEIDGAYFLDFVPDSKKKIAYAASFGKTEASHKSSKKLRKYLSSYDYITVREKSAVEIINKLGLNNVTQVLDPTLLLDKNEWSKLIDNDINDKYVLLYQLHSNPEMDCYADEFAKKAGLKLIRLTPLFHRTFKSGKAVYLPDISTFLSYIKNAEYMITDSFHGTAFAINFNTQFIDILPGETKTRNQSILELAELSERILNDYNDFSFIDNKIDFTNSNEKIAQSRVQSLELLYKMLTTVSDKN
ncbi:MAG: polysaccharide pyruvyl transferase family protein [Eubacterium sp.]|nr:polysaccharide pyruvyl transferase family protein [Eubacterium sp.]MDE6155432.1 polysaccharide pyruvyl transferase family protein [Eubacterium sp.]